MKVSFCFKSEYLLNATQPDQDLRQLDLRRKISLFLEAL
eukprot:UN26786